MSHELYDNPLIGRYASREMSALWGPQRKFSTWRRLWVALAQSQAELGLPITPGQIAEMRPHVDEIDFAAAERYERKLRHDVMAHVHAFGDLCPKARPIIHLGATSCYVTDNTDLILIREGLQLVAQRLAGAIDRLAKFAAEHRDLPCLAFTHFQPAQPTTDRQAGLPVGLRPGARSGRSRTPHRQPQSPRRQGHDRHAGQLLGTVPRRSCKRCLQLDRLVTDKMGFAESYAVTGQTYSRKVDAQVLDVLAGVAGSRSQGGHRSAAAAEPQGTRRAVRDAIRSARRRWPTSGIRCGPSGSADWPASS